jgi:FkbM family methyltransferase
VEGLVGAVKRQLRDLQTFAPGIRAAKFGLYNLASRRAGWFVEPEFKLLAAVAPVGLAIDIGGNWGQSVHALKRYARPDTLLSIEPNPALGQRLDRVFRSSAGVTIKQVALSDAPGQLTLHVPRYRNFVYDGLASLDREAAAEWLNAERMARFDPDKLSIDTYPVAIETLDQYGLTPDIIKIDVQGLEEKVASGGRETIRAAKPIMIVEAPTSGFVELMGQAGLLPYRWTGSRLLPHDTGGNNTLFLSDEKKHAIERWIGA